jgi:UDP-N-acetylmuramyl pentapeptide synthase
MNTFGEIAAHTRLAQPTIGVVTTIAAAHLEGVGSIEGVQKAKGELVEAIPPGGLVILNADDALVLGLADRAQARVVTFGQSATADVRIRAVSATATGVGFTLAADGTTVGVRLPLPGRHNAWNAAAAVAVGLALGVTLEEAALALGQAAPAKGRLVWREAGAVHLLDDTYNANPTSLRAALDVLRSAGVEDRTAGRTPRLWAVLGDMRELGLSSEAAHRDAGLWVAALPVAGLATAGPGMRVAAEVARAAGCPDVASFDAPEAAAAHVAARLAPGDRVLVKGSRGMRMERALESLVTALEARWGTRC